MPTSESEAAEFEGLLEEFIASYYRGEAPRPSDYAKRAGSREAELMRLISTFLLEAEEVLPDDAAAERAIALYGAAAAPNAAEFEGLLEEFIASYYRGEAPRPSDYAKRAGSREAELMRLISTFLLEAEEVLPDDAAAERVAAPYGGEARISSGWLEGARATLRDWVRATREVRLALLDTLSNAGPSLRLTAATRGGAGAPGGTPHVFVLDHEAGARVVLDENGKLALTVNGLPAEFVGTRPLITFPRLDPSADHNLAWSGGVEDLPDGVIRPDEPVSSRGHLAATLGILTPPSAELGQLLSEVHLIAPTLNRDLGDPEKPN